MSNKETKKKVYDLAKEKQDEMTFMEFINYLDEIGYPTNKGTLFKWCKKWNIVFNGNKEIWKPMETDGNRCSEYIQSKDKIGRNRYNKKKLDKEIAKEYIKTKNLDNISSNLGVPNDVIRAHLYKKDDTGKSLSQKIKDKRKKQVEKSLAKIIDKMYQNIDSELNLDDNLLKLKNFVLSEIGQKIKEMKSSDKSIDLDILKELQERIVKLKDIDVNANKHKLIQMFKDMGYIDKDTTIQNINIDSDKTIVMNDFLNFVVEDD